MTSATIQKNNTRSPGIWKSAARRFCRSPLPVAGLVLLLAVILLCALAPFISQYDYLAIDLSNTCAGPDAEHLLGTDTLGRDMLSRMLYGGRTTLRITFTALALSAVAGTVIGLFAGFFGGTVDLVIMRLTEALASVPTVLLAIVVECAIGWGHGYYMYAIAIAFIPPVVRLLRTLTMNIMGSEYIEAARALGVGSAGIIFRHVLHNVASPLIVHLSASAAEILLTCTVLSYIGLGVTPPEPEWGIMVNIGYSYLFTAPHVCLIPCLAVIVCALCMNLVGIGLRDALDTGGRSN